jgi:hypothetical protein
LTLDSRRDIHGADFVRIPDHDQFIITTSGNQLAIGRELRAVNGAVVTREDVVLLEQPAVGCRLPAVGQAVLADSR